MSRIGKSFLSATLGIVGLTMCGTNLLTAGFGGTGILACAEFPGLTHSAQPGMAVPLGRWAQEQGAPTPAAPNPPAPAAGAQEHNNVRPAIKWQRFDYACEDNAKIVVMIHDSSAKIYFQDHLYLMRQTPAADGARYSDGKVAWWSKGNNGFLQEEDTEIGEGRRVAKNCYRVASPAETARSSTVTGTLTYLVRMALPSQAVVQVQLLDLSGEGGVATETLVAEDKFTLGQRGVPLPFALKVDSAKLDPKHTYGVNARISLLGQVRFANKEPYKVLTQGNPTKVDMVLLPAGKP